MSWRGMLGEPLALDLVNTVVRDARGETDLLDSPASLRDWLAAEADAGRVEPTVSEIDLEEVIALRAHIDQAVQKARRGESPAVRELAAIVDAQRAAPAYRDLAWDGGSLTATVRRDGTATANLLAELAQAAAELLASPSITDVRQCEGAHCRMLFLPANPRRRWCSPAICGNRARVARYYENHKG